MSFNTEHRTPAAGDGDTARRRLRVVGSDAPAAVRAKISVLYVEDDTDDIFLVGHQLSRLASFEVDFVHASTLGDARFEISRRRFDVILCDFWLESETTIPFIGELKAAAGSTPVVLVSSLENDDIELIGRRAGADGFVAKADLSAAAIDRVFTTLLQARSAAVRHPAGGGVAAWLKALLRSLDRVHAASALAMAENGGDASRLGEFLSEIIGDSEELRSDIREKLAGLERATAARVETSRFDAVPYIAHAVRRQSARRGGSGAVGFHAPLLPVQIETNPTIFGDLVDGFMAEAGDLAERGLRVDVGVAVDDGTLRVVLRLSEAAGRPDAAGGGDIEEAAASERRFLVEALARAASGTALFAAEGGDGRLGWGEIARLDVPLRPVEDRA